MHKPEALLENETNKILFDFEIQTNHRIAFRKPNLVLITKKKSKCIMDFAMSSNHRVKVKGAKKLNNFLDLAS